ncbi:MAG: endonuclease VII domain-containing protein [Actinomycetota bacterium]
MRRWQQANPERVREVRRRNNARPERKARTRDAYLKRTYGITQVDYDRMLEAQGGGCAICGRRPRPDISLHVDHDHHTSQIRGLTCFLCNNALGDMEEDSRRFARAADYLDQHDPEVQRLAELTRARLYALVGR